MTPLTDTAVWLFCPGDRPDRYERALESSEVVIIDLQDAVAPSRKAGARDAVIAAAPWDPARVIVRINAVGTPQSAADVQALRRSGIETVMLPMATTPKQVEELEGFAVVALCETAAGILASWQIADVSNCVAITWGVEDLTLELGAEARDAAGGMLPAAAFARSTVRYAAAAAAIPAYDTVWTAIDDLDGVAGEARDAAGQGFAGKMVIHPRHVEPVTHAFRPSEAALERARTVMDAVTASAGGVVAVDGQMIDRPVVERAARILARAAR